MRKYFGTDGFRGEAGITLTRGSKSRVNRRYCSTSWLCFRILFKEKINRKKED